VSVRHLVHDIQQFRPFVLQLFIEAFIWLLCSDRRPGASNKQQVIKKKISQQHLTNKPVDCA